MIFFLYFLFRSGFKTAGLSGVVRRNWKWAPSNSRTPPPAPLPCWPSAALPPAPWAPACSWTPGSPLRSPAPPPCSRSQASWAARRASRALTLLLLPLPCPRLCRPPSSAHQPWDTALTCLTSGQCAPRPRRTSAQLIQGTPVLPRWGWRPRNTFSRLGRRGDADYMESV